MPIRLGFAVLWIAGITNMCWGQHIPSPTLGGTQFWTDHFVHGSWRIQQHAVTGHYRLLDDQNVRQAWGTYEHCRARFDALKRQADLPPLTETAVVTVHGLGRTRRSMQALADELADTCGWSSINLSYASTRQGVANHSQALRHVLQNLAGVKTVHLVGHSLGNIVIRHCLAARAADELPRIGRVVMLAPPNTGSSVARIIQDNKLFEWMGGTAGQQLGVDWDRLAPQLATPARFGIIAGSTRDGQGSNPWIPGDDDLIVGVAETKLPGARDFLVVNSLHTLVMDQEEVRRATASFLQHGHFVSADKRQPLQPAE